MASCCGDISRRCGPAAGRRTSLCSWTSRPAPGPSALPGGRPHLQRNRGARPLALWSPPEVGRPTSPLQSGTGCFWGGTWGTLPGGLCSWGGHYWGGIVPREDVPGGYSGGRISLGEMLLEGYWEGVFPTVVLLGGSGALLAKSSMPLPQVKGPTDRRLDSRGDRRCPRPFRLAQAAPSTGHV